MAKQSKTMPKQSVKKQTHRPKKTGRKTGKLVPQPHGGAILDGAASPERHVPGPGRPKDEVRQKLLGLAHGAGYDFLRDLMDGKITTQLIGTCAACGAQAPLDPALGKILSDRIGASVDQRLKGLDLSLRYGVGTKDEIDVATDKMRSLAQQWRAQVVERAIDEICSPTVAAKLRARIDALTTQEGA